MTALGSVGPPARWPTWVGRLGITLGLVASVRILTRLDDVSATLVAVVVAVWIALGVASASAVLLVAAAVQRVLRRSVTALTSPTPQMLAMSGGAALGVGGIVVCVLLGRLVEELALVALAGLMLAMIAFRTQPPVAALRAVALLVAAIAIVIVPRELGWIGANWFTSDQSSKRDGNWSTGCHGANAWHIESQLDGNIGELVPRGPVRPGHPGELVLRAHGTVDGGGPLCYTPLYKSVHVETTINISYTLTIAGATCSGAGTVRLVLDRSVKGFASCRDVREDLAQTVSSELATVAKQLVER